MRMTAALLALASALALAGCRGEEPVSDSDRKPQLNNASADPDPEAGQRERAIGLHFSHTKHGQPVETVENSGDLPVYTRVVSTNDGQLIAVPSPFGTGVQTPPFAETSPKFAILAVFNKGSDDLLSPGEQDFIFGADFSIDPVTTGAIVDDGDNLVARGLFESAGQYKLQVDNGKLSCRVAGLRGEVFMKAPVRLEPGEWYRARCLREGDTVSLAVAPITAGETIEDDDWSRTKKTGPIGDVLMASTVPLAIGGKLAPDGRMFSTTTDQFNGKFDRVVYRLLN
jgi:hypothetical protein